MNIVQGSINELDLLVVGGGLAGVAAAVTAAASGASTLLVEAGERLGGNATQAFVHTFCGLYEPPRDGGFEYANPGFSAWFAEGLMKAGGALEPEVHGRVGVLPIFPPRLADYALRITGQFSNLDVLLDTRLTALSIEGEAGKERVSASCRQRDQVYAIAPKSVIDASGDAVAGQLAGAATEAPGAEELQNATLIFRVSGANPAELAGYSRLKLSAAVARGAVRGELPQECESVLVRPGETAGEAYISLNLPKWPERHYAPLDHSFMRAYTRHAHDLGEALIRFLRSRQPGWSDCALLEWPSRIGVRETRHMRGRYIMQEEDILRGAKFPDAVARSSWPVELWHGHKGASFKYPDAVAEIPLRALVSRSFETLGMAGRCMSGTHEALGALRVLGTAMATGEAVGLAAAIAAEKDDTLAAVSSDEVNIGRERLTKSLFRQS